MNTLRYILARLREPGSVRSLVLALFLIRGQAVDDALVGQITDAVLTLLAIVSFLMPGDAPAPALAAPRKAADTVTEQAGSLLTSLKGRL